MTPIYPGPIGTDGFGGFQTLSAELPLGHSGNSSRSFFSDDFLTNDRMEYPLADASRTLFLGDLSYFCTEEDLCAVFAGYGPILTVRVRRGVTGESLMHGFIALDTPEAARQAILDLDGIEFMGRNMRVQLSSDGQRPGPGAKEQYVQVHVSFISKQVGVLVTEKVLRDVFSPFGEIADVAIKKHTTIHKQHRQSGYGFVYFFMADSAYRAMHSLKHHTVRDITLDCSISHKSEYMIKQTTQRPYPVPRSVSDPHPSSRPVGYYSEFAPANSAPMQQLYQQQPIPPPAPLRRRAFPPPYSSPGVLPNGTYTPRVPVQGLVRPASTSLIHPPPSLPESLYAPLTQAQQSKDLWPLPAVSTDDYGDGTPNHSFYRLPLDKQASDMTDNLSVADDGSRSSSGSTFNMSLLASSLSASLNFHPSTSSSSIATLRLHGHGPGGCVTRERKEVSDSSLLSPSMSSIWDNEYTGGY